MGVVYRLKPEIIDAIVKIKQDDPQISCRKLALLVNNKYQLNISKSSINTVLKNAKLSSAIGRRPVKKPAKKVFAIPRSKKEQLYKEIKKADKFMAVSQEEAVKEPLPQPEIVREDIPQESPGAFVPEAAQPAPEDKDLVVKEKVELPGQGSRDFIMVVDQIREENKNVLQEKYPGLGVFLLLALEWHVCSSSVLAKLVERILPDENDKDLLLACSKMFVSVLLGSIGKKKEEEVACKLLDILFPCDAHIDEPKIVAVLAELGRQRMEFEHLSLSSSIFMNVCGFALSLENGDRVLVDPRCFSVWQDNVPGSYALPINKAMSVLSNSIISNVSPAVFAVVPEGDLYANFLKTVAAFENITGLAIQKASVLGREMKEITDFSIIPKKKRVFSVGVYPWQKHFNGFLKSSKWVTKNPFYVHQLDLLMYYSENLAPHFCQEQYPEMPDLRVFALWEENGEEPRMLIVSNDRKKNALDIIVQYLLQYPGLERDSKIVKAKEGLLEEGQAREAVDFVPGRLKTAFRTDEVSLVEYMSWLIAEELFGFSCREILSQINSGNVNDFLAMLAGLQGSIRIARDSVVLVFSSEDVNRQDKGLAKLIEIVGEMGITDPCGRRVLISVS